MHNDVLSLTEYYKFYIGVLLLSFCLRKLRSRYLLWRWCSLVDFPSLCWRARAQNSYRARSCSNQRNLCRRGKVNKRNTGLELNTKEAKLLTRVLSQINAFQFVAFYSQVGQSRMKNQLNQVATSNRQASVYSFLYSSDCRKATVTVRLFGFLFQSDGMVRPKQVGYT